MAKKKRKKRLAEKVDRHELYQNAVQTPDADVDFFTKVFKKLRKRKPQSLREDFCGTAYLSTEWVKSSSKRTAFGVDIDESVVEWGLAHNVKQLKKSARERVELQVANVLDGVGGKSDVACAMNFSYCVFKERSQLLSYFEVVRDVLVDDGLFFTELYGGFEAVVELEEDRDCGGGVTYVWQQEKYNPINNHTLCHIHFDFKDGSRLEKAFTYDWRLWSITEMRDLLLEAGFADVKVYWETTDEDGDGTGEFHETAQEENQDSWLVYIVALR